MVEMKKENIFTGKGIKKNNEKNRFKLIIFFVSQNTLKKLLLEFTSYLISLAFLTCYCHQVHLLHLFLRSSLC